MEAIVARSSRRAQLGLQDGVKEGRHCGRRAAKRRPPRGSRRRIATRESTGGVLSQSIQRGWFEGFVCSRPVRCPGRSFATVALAVFFRWDASGARTRRQKVSAAADALSGFGVFCRAAYVIRWRTEPPPRTRMTPAGACRLAASGQRSSSPPAQQPSGSVPTLRRASRAQWDPRSPAGRGPKLLAGQ